MLTCKEITELATAFAEGQLAEAERSDFVAHVAGCHGCATWVRQLTATAQALGRLPDPELPPVLRVALEARFDAWAQARALAGAGSAAATEAKARPADWRRFTLVPVAALVLAFALLVGLARHPSGDPTDWIVAAGLAVVSVALVVSWRRVTLGFAATAAAAALVAAVVSGGGGALDGAEGLHCLLTVGGVAAGAGALAWATLRRAPRDALASALGTWTAAGALTSVAALQVSCGGRSSLAHLLAFHVGGLLAVLAVAALATRPRAGLARG